MFLSPEFVDHEAYFSNALNFLSDFKWIYNFPNTKILVNEALNEIPKDWATALLALTNAELNNLPQGLIKEDWPFSLVDFCQRCSSLRIPSCDLKMSCISEPDLPYKLQQGLSPKKQYEVRTLAAIIHAECQLHGITRILDVGSGVGYLGQLLHYWYGYQVLGFESDEGRVKTANRRQSKLCPTSNAVNFVTCKISVDSTDQIRQAMTLYLDSLTINLDRRLSVDQASNCSKNDNQSVGIEKNTAHGRVDKSDSEVCVGCKILKTSTQECLDQDETEGVKSTQHHKPVCLVGLHACGDLTVDTTNMFLEIPSIHSMILVPCCYHKMSLVQNRELENSCGELFHKFPASSVLRNLFDAIDPSPTTFLKRPFLRLASQQTSELWKNCSEEAHRKHSMHVMTRGLLELLAHQDRLLLKKKHRRGVLKSQISTFESFMNSALERYEFLNECGEVFIPTSEFRSKAEKLWEEFSPLCSLVEVLTGLQTMLQGVTEQLVSCDRICYLKENSSGKIFCESVRVFDDNISPRCLAIIARK